METRKCFLYKLVFNVSLCDIHLLKTFVFVCFTSLIKGLCLRPDVFFGFWENKT